MKNGGLTEANVEAALRKHNGNMAAVGRHFGVTRQAVYDFVSRYPALGQVATDCRESMKDEAESSLYKAVKKGEAWAVCFFLKTQAKKRGYVERTESRVVDDDDLNEAIESELERLATGRPTGDAQDAPVTPDGDAPP